MKKATSILLVCLMIIQLTACVSSATKDDVTKELISRLGGKTYYCHVKEPRSEIKSSGFSDVEEHVVTMTFNEDCSSADTTHVYQITKFYNGFHNQTGERVTINYPCDVEIKVKNKDTAKLILKYSYIHPALEEEFGPYKDTLIVHLNDENADENGLKFDDIEFSNIDKGEAPFTSEYEHIEGY